MGKYGVLLISGRRTHQEAHAVAFAASPLCDLVAVTDEKEVSASMHKRGRQLAEDHGIPYIDDLDIALQREDVDIVSMCADVERRGRVAVKCAKAGKHIYLDKPMAGTIQDIDSIVKAVHQAGVKSQMFSFIHTPWATRAKNAIKKGSIGTLKAVHAEILFAKGAPIGTVPDGGVREEKEHVEQYTFINSKREGFDIGVYVVGLVCWLTGKKPESVYGLTGNYIFADHYQNDVEDFSALTIEMEDGLMGTTVSGRIGWMSHPRGGPMRVFVIGSKGTLVVDGSRPRVEIYNEETDFTSPRIHPLDPMGMWASTNAEVDTMPKNRWVLLNDDSMVMHNDVNVFIDCINTDREPIMNAAAAAPLTEVILAGYISSARDQSVTLPLSRDKI